MSDYEIKMLNRPVLIKIVKEQQEIINKAIEYVKNIGCYNNEYKLCTQPMNSMKLDNLLNILQGDEK